MECEGPDEDLPVPVRTGQQFCVRSQRCERVVLSRPLCAVKSARLEVHFGRPLDGSNPRLQESIPNYGIVFRL